MASPQTESESHKPFYYVRKRLKRNKTAVFGLMVVALAAVIALLGYLIMPDSTPNANDGTIEIAKQPPVFSVQMLKVRKDMEVEEVSFFERMVFGQESKYTIIPLNEEVIVDNDSVYFKVFSDKGIENRELKMPLISIVKPLYVGTSEKLGKDLASNYVVKGDSIHYLDIKETRYSIHREDLVNEFYQNHLEKRTYLLGTDKSGRDMLSRLLFGARISLAIGAIAVLISLGIGVVFGAIAGFFGGRIDNIIMWLMTVIWTVPTIMLVICISLALNQRGIWVAFVAVGLTMWVDIARVVRGQIFSIKQKQFVEAAQAFGFSNRRIIFKHILPNIFGPLIVICTSNFASAILIEAGLSFLGLGVSPPMPSWGVMINEGFAAFATRNSWHLIWLPSLCISIMVLAFNLLGNGLRDAYDPQSLK